MPGPSANILQQPTLYDPNVLQQIQQLLQAAGPYAAPVMGGLALVPPVMYAVNPGVRQDMNAAMASDLAALQGLGQQAFGYTVPGMIMQARRAAGAQAQPTAQPRGAAKPQMGGASTSATPVTARGAATPATPQMTPAPTPPQFPSGPQRDIAKGLSLLGAASMARPLIYGEVGGALPAMWQRMGQDAQAVGSAMQQAATGGKPLVRMYARPMAGMMAIPQATTAPTPTPGMTGAPMNTPTSAQSRVPAQSDAIAAMPDGSVFEIEGVGLVQRRGAEVYPVTPTPSGSLAGR